jgi:hypothetical protein
MSTGAVMGFMRCCTAVLATAAALLVPVGEARAVSNADIVAAVKLVCGNVPDVCGPYDDVVVVADACLKGSDELACGVAVASVSGNSGPQQAFDRYLLVMECTKDATVALPVTPACDQKLAEAGMPEADRNEAKALVTLCVQAQNVDDVVICADALLGSSFAADAGINPPSWVDSMFDIYIDIRTPDYLSLIQHVGASVACLVVNIVGGIDVCGVLETLAAIGGAILDGLGAVGEFFSDLFGGGCWEWQGQCVPVHQLLAKLLEVGLAVSVEARKAGDPQWAARRGQAFTDIKKHQVFVLGGYPATPADEEAAWTIHKAQVYPLWDTAMKGVVEARKAKIEAELKAVKPLDVAQGLQGDITTSRAKCMAASKDETDKIVSWTQEGRAPKGMGVLKHDATCGYRVTQVVLGGLNACALQLNDTTESLRAKCDSGTAMIVCKAAQASLGNERVAACDFGKGGEKGVAHMTLKTWAPAPVAQRCTYDEATFTNAFKCNDPAAAKECTSRIGGRYGKLDWPKAGTAECKVVETPKRLKAVADAAKVAQAIPGVVMPGSKMNNLGCKPDGIDAAIVSCVQVVLDATQVAKVKAAADVPVRQCTTAESTTKPTHAWLEEACIAQAPWKNVQVTKDLAKPASTGPATMEKLGPGGAMGAGLKGGPGTPGGPGSGAGLTGGKTGPGVANPAQPGAKTGPGVVNPASPKAQPGVANPATSRTQPGAIDKKLTAPSSLKQPGT